ncbi:RMD1 family protein [Aureitalea sp. L0-47]|uniref:RMD1 family protein n=1 Tax=Aureitalea sp. L0-47 TaxID=2816962 RepID=UPI002238F9FF|nr:RMD1 family protein [Aureitalea sp. L0-47]MCW5518642.1 RMD1 family protein [Aureitalea sp. L0-47]
MYTIQTIQVAQSINIRSVREIIDGTLLFQDSDELYYSLGARSYLYIFQFGVVCFFNLPEKSVQKYKKKILQFSKGEVEPRLTDDFLVKLVSGKSIVSTTEVILPVFDEEMIRLVMLHTAQNVALENYTSMTESLLEEAGIHTHNLQNKGALRISKKKLKMLIGRNLTLKNAIYENLYIFDVPEIAIENQQLNSLDQSFKREFDLKNRYRHVNDRINIINENLQLFKDIWDHKESSTLEWIIIILIFVEIVDLFIGKLL